MKIITTLKTHQIYSQKMTDKLEKMSLILTRDKGLVYKVVIEIPKRKTRGLMEK